MSQDQFDKWLKDSIQSVQSDVDLDQEWQTLNHRLADDRRKRRVAAWWWIAGSSVAILTIALFSLNLEGAQTEINDDHDRAKVLQQHHALGEKNHHSDAIQTPDLQRGTSESENVIQNVSSSSGEATSTSSADAGESRATSLTDLQAERLIETSPIPQSWNEMPIRQTSIVFENAPATSETRSRIDVVLLPLANSNLELEFPDLAKPQFKSKDPLGPWSVELSFMAGTFINDYKESGKDPALTSAFTAVEEAQEVLGGELLVNCDLGNGWQLGAGVGIMSRHISYSQRFSDTIRGTSPDQIIRTLEDFDGNISNIYGSGDGQYVYDVERRNHQIFISLSTPIRVRKAFFLNRKVSMGLHLGIAPVFFVMDRGNSIVSNENDLFLMDLKDRYDSDISMDIRGGYDLSWHLDNRHEVFAGLVLSYQVLGRPGMNEAWDQNFHNGMINLGFRKQI